MIDSTEIAVRHTYHAPKPGQPSKYEAIRAAGRHLANAVNELCPDSREAALAQTKIEEAVFWANAAIARREIPSQPPIDNAHVAPGCEKFTSPQEPFIEVRTVHGGLYKEGRYKSSLTWHRIPTL